MVWWYFIVFLYTELQYFCATSVCCVLYINVEHRQTMQLQTKDTNCKLHGSIIGTLQEYHWSTVGVFSGVVVVWCAVLAGSVSVTFSVFKCRKVSKQQTSVGCVPSRPSSTNQLPAPPHVVLLFTTRLESNRGGC